MGASTSCFPRYGCCVPKNRSLGNNQYTSSTPKVAKGHRRNLSAAFNMADVGNDVALEQMNINTATEEELMTLPGINRQIANTIVEYRQQIGGFKKVEDLALVSGVGAAKLGILRLEISVTNKKSSIDGSLSSSQQDISFPDNASASNKSQKSSNYIHPRVNLNMSNVFQLMKVKGISQNLAENIVSYRDRKGFYQSVDDLIKVKGVRPYLSAIRPYLTLEDTSEHNGGIRPAVTSQVSNNPNQLYPNLSNMSTFDQMGSQETLCSMYGPLGRRSNRVKLSRAEKRKQCIKIATWNLQQCSSEKTENLGVREVVAMTILENNLGIVAVQELKDKDALFKLCEELNHPVIPNVKKWPSNRGTWKCVTSPVSGRMFQGSEHLGFMYDTSQGIELVSAELLDSSVATIKLARKPYLAIFQLRDYDLVVVNVHLKATGLKNEDIDRTSGEVDSLGNISQVIGSHIEGVNHGVILGDFNMKPNAEEFAILRNLGYSNVFHEDQYTNISTRNPEGTCNYDNIWLGMHASMFKTGSAEIIRDGLNSPWIPDGWGWGGLASDHCPAWVELHTTRKGAKNHNNNDEHRVEDIKVAVRGSAS